MPIKNWAGNVKLTTIAKLQLLIVHIYTGCAKKMSRCLALYCKRMKKNKEFKPFTSFRGGFNLNFDISYSHFEKLEKSLIRDLFEMPEKWPKTVSKLIQSLLLT